MYTLGRCTECGAYRIYKSENRSFKCFECGHTSESSKSKTIKKDESIELLRDKRTALLEEEREDDFKEDIKVEEEVEKIDIEELCVKIIKDNEPIKKEKLLAILERSDFDKEEREEGIRELHKKDNVYFSNSGIRII